MNLLYKEDDNGGCLTWHRAYRCSGIKYCAHSAPHIIMHDPGYDRVTPRVLQDLAQRACEARYTPPDNGIASLRVQTEAFYNACITRWQSAMPYLCEYGDETQEPTCLHQRPEIFKRHGVSTTSEYTETMLNFDRHLLSAVQTFLTWNHGIMLILSPGTIVALTCRILSVLLQLEDCMQQVTTALILGAQPQHGRTVVSVSSTYA
jgi:hypothetical protein